LDTPCRSYLGRPSSESPPLSPFACYYLYSLPLCASTGKGPRFIPVFSWSLRIRPVSKAVVLASGSFDHFHCFQDTSFTDSYCIVQLFFSLFTRLWKTVGDLLGYWLRLSTLRSFFSYLLHKSLFLVSLFPLFFLCPPGLLPSNKLRFSIVLLRLSWFPIRLRI